MQKIDPDTLTILVENVKEAFRGFIALPFQAYAKALRSNSDADDLLACFLYDDKAETAETALDLLLKDKRVTPPVMNGLIQKHTAPIGKKVDSLEKKLKGLAGHKRKSGQLNQAAKDEQVKANRLARRKRARAAKKLRKQQEKQKAGGDKTEDAGASGGSNTKQQQTPKNSKRHPGKKAHPVTEKKGGNSGSEKEGKRAGKRRRGGKGGKNVTNTTPSSPSTANN